MKRFGTKYGGFYYPENLEGLDKNSIIYCVGAGEDISHDIEIANKLNSKVYIFDPTPRAINHVNYIKKVFNGEEVPKGNKRFGGGFPGYLDLLLKNKIDSKNIIFYDYGLYTENTEMKFYKPSNQNYVSHSLVLGMKSNNFMKVQVKKLKTIMQELNHTKIDLLKIDIEGCECEVLKQMIEEEIYPKYLSVDFDLGWTGEKIKDRKKCLDTIAILKNYYNIIKSDGPDYSFIKKEKTVN